jgi:hypothetical protein
VGHRAQPGRRGARRPRPRAHDGPTRRASGAPSSKKRTARSLRPRGSSARERWRRRLPPPPPPPSVHRGSVVPRPHLAWRWPRCPCWPTPTRSSRRPRWAA